jgi:tetratricopeptide (TPR) repeat protein
MRRVAFAALLAAGVFAPSQQAFAQRCEIEANGGSVGICGEVKDSTITIGVPLEKVEELVRERTKPLEELTAAQKETISVLKEKLDLNERQIRATLDILGEKDVPPERLAAKLVEIAERYKALTANASTQAGDDPNTTALKEEAQRAIDDGQLEKADALLAQVETEQRRALDRFAFGAAETSARRGEIALTRLRYRDAAARFADAAAVFPPNSDHEDQRIDYLEREADALYRQGDEFGDNAALVSAIAREKRLLELKPRERVPLDWATAQVNLGVALASLGERESGTGKLEEAVAAYREALKERTRERVPIDWARTQANLGTALETLGERESGTGKLEEAVAAYREALKELTRERVPLDWAKAQIGLGKALFRLGERESGTGKLEEAVAAYREALRKYTRARVPLDWATTQNNLGEALQTLGARESGTTRLVEAVAAYRAALEERTQARVPLDWATTQMNLGNALAVLADRQKSSARMEEALACMRNAVEVYQQAGESYRLPAAQRQIKEMETELTALKR